MPILTAEKGLSETELAELTSSAQAQTQLRTGEFVRDLEGSDAFHWGKGTIYVRDDRIWLDGAIAPGHTGTVFWPRNRKPCKLRR